MGDPDLNNPPQYLIVKHQLLARKNLGCFFCLGFFLCLFFTKHHRAFPSQKCILGNTFLVDVCSFSVATLGIQMQVPSCKDNHILGTPPGACTRMIGNLLVVAGRGHACPRACAARVRMAAKINTEAMWCLLCWFLCWCLRSHYKA